MPKPRLQDTFLVGLAGCLISDYFLIKTIDNVSKSFYDLFEVIKNCLCEIVNKDPRSKAWAKDLNHFSLWFLLLFKQQLSYLVDPNFKNSCGA